jgi:hypothetical protein
LANVSALVLLGWPLLGMSWSPTGYKKTNVMDFFSYKLKENGVSLSDLICLKVAISGYKGQIIVRLLAFHFYKLSNQNRIWK